MTEFVAYFCMVVGGIAAGVVYRSGNTKYTLIVLFTLALATYAAVRAS